MVGTGLIWTHFLSPYSVFSEDSKGDNTRSDVPPRTKRIKCPRSGVLKD